MKNRKKDWATIPDTTCYEVSFDGAIRSLDRIIFVFNNGTLATCRRRGKIIKQQINPRTGYPIVKINGGETHAVHRLVWKSFYGPIPKGVQVNHINGVKTDNRLENLELTTPRENIRHSIGIGTYHASGIRRKTPSREDILIIRFFYSKGGGINGTASILAKIFAVTHHTVWKIGTGISHKDINPAA